MVIAHGEYAGSVENEDGTSMGHAMSTKWTRQFRMKSSSTYEVHHSYRHLRNIGCLQEYNGQAYLHAYVP